MDDIEYSTYNAKTITQGIIEEMATLYEDDFVGLDLKDKNPEFYSIERFSTRVNNWYMTRPRFQCVLARLGTELVGFSTASNLRENDSWWSDAHPSLHQEFIFENGKRTMAIFDFMTKSSFRGQKVASNMHKILLGNSNTERVTLLSSEQQQPAHYMWFSWDYLIISKRIKNDQPVLDLFVLDRTKSNKVHS